MRLSDIMERCRVEDGHWLWVGALSNGKVPRIWAPDYTRGGMTSQPGRRAVWHVKTGKPIPNGWRVFGTCERTDCISPIHLACKEMAQWGRELAASDKRKGSVMHQVASRATGRKRSKLTPEMIQRIKSDPEMGYVLAEELGVSKTTVSKVRRHGCPSFEPVGGLFSGLMQ